MQQKLVEPLRARGVTHVSVEHMLDTRVATAHGITNHNKVWLRVELRRVEAFNNFNTLRLKQRAHRWVNVGIRTSDFMP